MSVERVNKIRFWGLLCAELGVMEPRKEAARSYEFVVVPSSAIPCSVTTIIRSAFLVVARRCAMINVVLPTDKSAKDL